MPQIGDIGIGRELGYKSLNKRFVWFTCLGCGKERWVELIHNQPKSVRCHSCQNGKGKNHIGWRGGRQRDRQGYVRVKLEKDSPFFPMAFARGYVQEHRLVVAKALGRCLLPWEVVHHKNGCAKDDNRYPETLELITDKFHLVDTETQSYIKRLEKKIATLITENAKLRKYWI